MKHIPFATGIIFSLLFSAIFISNDNQAIRGNYTDIPSQNESILLPIEVLGNEGTVVERIITLSSSEVSAANELWLLMNNISYQDKASIQVNDGNWISLNHTTANVHPKELAYGGMAHGAVSTIRLIIPLSGLITGANTLKFRFNTSDGISIGYRVVALNILDSNGEQLLPESRFTQEDPADWTAPAGSSVSNGRDLWHNRGNLWNHYDLNNTEGFWYSHSVPAKRTIRAKCTDCHTRDGRDLEIFSYSNLSIIERSKFHGLSEQEGKDIAAYIRSLSAEPGVARYGRPWNPPYQPGPVLKDKPIAEWSAGAGLEWVLETDAEMAPYLFGENISKYSVYDYFNANKMDDRTLIPLAIQFPDWKHWLPIVHPMDAFSRNDFIYNQGTRPLAATEDFIAWLDANKNNENEIRSRFIRKHWDWYGTFRNFIQDGATNPRHWRTLFNDSPAYQHLNDGINAEIAATSLARYMAVKNFQIMNEYELQDKADWFTNPEDQPGTRQWPSRKYNVFEIPPHFTGLAYDNNSDAFEGQSRATGFFESTNWYHLQFILNGGNGLVGGTTPSDFNYLNEFIGKTMQQSGIDEPLRYYSTVNQMYQIRNWSGNLGTQRFDNYKPDESGFRIRNQGPFIFLGINHQNSMWYGKNNPERILEPLQNIHPELDKWVIEALLLQFLDEVNKSKNNLNDWDRNPDDDWGGSEIQYMLDRENITEIRDLPNSGLYQGHFSAKLFYTIQRLKETKVDCTILNELIDWCHNAWPNVNRVGNTTVNGGFNSLKVSNCATESCESNLIQTDRVYRIRTRHNKCVTMDEQNTIIQQSCTDSTINSWVLEAQNEGYYAVKNVSNNLYLTAPDVSNGTQLELQAFNGSDSQLYIINETSNCKYQFVNKAADKCMDLKSGQSDDGTIIQLWTCTNDSNSINREFYLEVMEEQTLSVSDLEENTSWFNIYPNPTANFAYLTIQDDLSKPLTVSIYNLNGQLVQQLDATESQLVLDLSSYAKGVYFITLQVNAKHYVTKVVKE
ncbi:RICIN domain-containing protein [Aquimarina brevivitae]|uniref:Putative secreted protein (Por secretion system target) n=1 Tax=Aquimarina brevivitae TaxID=323412 RepID=A0A4V2F5D7_9FLAO|nr:RICIN domain-containing protein [Aquimarina brevivitae]RZS92459.1 putative secreted protein (Por secretion system target) [Aquimarina brevivitae]